MRYIVAVLSAVLAACSGEATVVDTAPIGGVTDFAEGEFQLYVEGVEDQCLDGALDLLFMPDGADADYPLANQTFFPASADLPSSYVMRLQTPFDDMTITMEASGDGMRIRDALQADVLLNVPGTDDCTADISFDADIQLLTADSLRLSTTATITGLSSPTETCPTLETDPCSAILTMRGERR